VRYRVFRSTFVPTQELGISPDESPAQVPHPFSEIGIADQPFFVDSETESPAVYHYFVVAEGVEGILSSPSNLARTPCLNSPVTFSGLRRTLTDWEVQSHTEASGERGPITGLLSKAEEQLDAGDPERAQAYLKQLRTQARLRDLSQLSSWRVQDFERLLGKLIQRVRLAQADIISPDDLR
jgi:hypothetical protein